MKIKVTKRDFKEAIRLVWVEGKSVSGNCAIAVAIKRMGGADVQVGANHIYVDGNLLQNLPKEVGEIEMMVAFREDADLSKLPITFEVS